MSLSKVPAYFFIQKQPGANDAEPEPNITILDHIRLSNAPVQPAKQRLRPAFT